MSISEEYSDKREALACHTRVRGVEGFQYEPVLAASDRQQLSNDTSSGSSTPDPASDSNTNEWSVF